MSYVKSEPGADPIVVESRYPVPPDVVFSAWTEPETIKQWFGTTPGGIESASVDLRPGGRWRFTEYTDQHGTTLFEGEYLEISPCELLVFTWSKVTIDHATGQRDATPDSMVEIRFTAEGQGTNMRIAHSELDPQSRTGFRYGWTTGMETLAALLTANPAAGQNR